MFHLYFGAFDFFLYVPAFLFVIALANAICDEMDAAELTVAPAVVQVKHPVTSEAENSNIREAAMPTSLSVREETGGDNVRLQSSNLSSEAIAGEGSTIDLTDKENRPILDFSKTRLYKLRKQLVVKLKDLSIELPETIQQYKLRGESVVYLHALETFAEVIT